MSYYKDTESCEETIYRIAHNLDKKPKCKTCGSGSFKEKPHKLIESFDGSI